MADIKNDSSVAAQQAQALHTPATALAARYGAVLDGSSTFEGNSLAAEVLVTMDQASDDLGAAAQTLVTNIGVIDQNFVAADQAGGR